MESNKEEVFKSSADIVCGIYTKQILRDKHQALCIATNRNQQHEDILTIKEKVRCISDKEIFCC
jgi:hypothetical protein